MNDSPVGCQSRRTDRSIFSAEKMQDRWFKSFSRNQPKTLENTAFSRVFHLFKNEGIPPYLNKLGDFWETNAKKVFSQFGFSLFFLQKNIIQKLAEKRQNILNNPPITTTSVLFRTCFSEIVISYCFSLIPSIAGTPQMSVPFFVLKRINGHLG